MHENQKLFLKRKMIVIVADRTHAEMKISGAILLAPTLDQKIHRDSLLSKERKNLRWCPYRFVIL